MTALEKGQEPPGPVLRVGGLSVTFDGDDGPVRAVDGVSFDVAPGEVLAVVGESGCGKSVTAMALSGLLPASATVTGSVRLGGTELVGAAEPALRAVRGAELAYVFQEPMTSLNPVFTVGRQIGEVLRIHRGMSRAQARARAAELLEMVGIPDAASRVRAYPHQFSGGMRQRVMIAMALACEPSVLVADEPTTALDVTVQAQVMDLLKDLQRDTGMGLVLITHDLGVVNEVADDVAVMYAGRIVERGTVDEVFGDPAHPYTDGLMRSIPQVEAKGGRLQPIGGQPPNLAAIPSGCPFHPRCPRRRTGAQAAPGRDCVADVPPLRLVVPGREAACHYSEEVLDV